MSRLIHSLTQLPIPLIPFLPPSLVELNLCEAKTLTPRNLRTFSTLRVNSTHRAEFMLMIDLVYPTPVVVFHYIRLRDRYDTQHSSTQRPWALQRTTRHLHCRPRG